jgi:hypothetical protein
VMYPVWISEGMAINFETGKALSAAAAQSGPRRMRLLESSAQGRLIPLEQFATMAQFRPDQGYDLRDTYAQAGGFFHFLLTRRPEALKGYLEQMKKCEPGRRDAEQLLAEFTHAFGPTPALTVDWLAYLKDLGGEKN